MMMFRQLRCPRCDSVDVSKIGQYGSNSDLSYNRVCESCKYCWNVDNSFITSK
jgi:transposase-like protein